MTPPVAAEVRAALVRHQPPAGAVSTTFVDALGSGLGAAALVLGVCALAPGGPARALPGRDDRSASPGAGGWPRALNRALAVTGARGGGGVDLVPAGRLRRRAGGRGRARRSQAEGHDVAAGLDAEVAPAGRDQRRAGRRRRRRRRPPPACTPPSVPSSSAPWAPPCSIDVALVLVRPVEARLLQPYVDRAAPAPARRRPPGGGHHRLLRQDDDQGLRGPPGGRELLGGRHPGQLQQHRRPGPGHKRAPGHGHPGVRGRNGDLRRR